MPISRFSGRVAQVPVDGGMIEAEEIGQGPAVLLVHGWTLHRGIWDTQIKALASCFRVIAYDRRGFGRSTAAPDLRREPDDLAAVADAFDAPHFALVGMSQGARVALAYAGRHPERVDAIAVQGAPLSGVGGSAGDDEDIPIAAMMRLAAIGDLDAMRRLWRGHPLMKVSGLQANARLDAIVADYDARDLLVSDQHLEVTTAEFARIRMPVLAINGREDTIWRHEASARLARLVKASQVEIADGGHLCNLCQPTLYNSAVVRFVEAATR